MLDVASHGRVETDVVQLIPALRSFARRFERRPEEADDLVQETLLRAIANIDKFEEGTRLKSWLFTIMRNTHNTRYAMSKRFQVGIEDREDLFPAVPAAQEWVMRGKEFERAFEEMPKHYRDVVDVVILQGVSYDNAAEQFHCPVGTVKSRVNRAKQHLAGVLGDPVSQAATI